MDLLSHTLTIGSRGAVVLAKFFRLDCPDIFKPYEFMFGDFKHEEKHRLLDIDDICQLENGIPIVACYNDREYQFGIYGKRHVIYQDCWTTKEISLYLV